MNEEYRRSLKALLYIQHEALRLPFVIGTWNPATWDSPWPYSRSDARIVTKRYRLAPSANERP